MKKNGFTLFELLISISIIGILTALAVISYSAAQRKARDAKRMQDMQMMQKAVEEVYSLSSYNYPTAVNPAAFTVGSQVILQNIPTDPKGSAPYVYQYSNLTVNSYCYCARLENPGSGNSGAACDFANVTKDYYCVRQQQ